jgi:hypothetical protein
MKKLLGIAVLLTILVTGAFAVPAGGITDYMFGVPGDCYMETQWYTGAGFTKFIASTEFSGNFYSDNNSTAIGFATKVGGLYLGLSYNGNIFDQVDYGYTESSIAWSGGDKNIKQYSQPIKLYDTFTWDGTELVWEFDANNPTRPSHDIGILLGFADMGILLGFNTDYQFFEVEDTAIETNNYKYYKQEFGTLTPSIKWGMAKNLTKKGIRPAVKFSIGFHTDQTQYEIYTGTWTTYGTTFEPTDNYTNIGVDFNLGGFTFLEKDGFNFSLDLDYSLSSTIYGDNQYTWVTGTTTYTFKETGRFGREAPGTGSTGRYINNGLFTTESKNAKHTIEPSIKATWDSEKIGVGMKLHLPVEISYDEYTYNRIDELTTTYVLIKDGTAKETSVGFHPVLKLGGQFRLVPNKFNINIGGQIDFSTIKEETNEITANAGTTVKVVTPSTEGTEAKTTFTIGATLLLTENVLLDVCTGVSDATSFDFFSLSGSSLTTFGRIYLQVRF